MGSRSRVGALIANDIVRAGIRAVLEGTGDIEAITSAGDIDSWSTMTHGHVDVVVVDVELPGPPPEELAHRVQHLVPDAGLVGLASRALPRRRQTLLAWGYHVVTDLWGTRESLLDAVRQASRGVHRYPLPPVAIEPSDLTLRELDVLRSISAALPNKQIGTNLGIAEGTVKRHANTIYRKLGVTSRAQAILAAQQRGLV